MSSLRDLSTKQRRNAILLVTGQSGSKLGDVICNAKTVLTWLMGVVGAPPAMTGMLVSIRESGSMLPQAFVSGWVKRVTRRKWVYVIGAVGQTLCLAMMSLAAFTLRGATAGLAILAALALCSFARCLCSIASKDVLGKTVPKGARGRVSGLAASISGLVGLGAAALAMLGVQDSGSPKTYGLLILGGSLLYLIAAATVAFVPEPESNDSVDDLTDDFRRRIGLVWEDRVLRRFLLARALLLGSALGSPYFVVLSQQQGLELRSLAAFVLAGGLASALSSFFWGRLSDRSSRAAMAVGGAVTALFGWVGVGVAWNGGDLASKPWIWPLLFFLANIGYAGVRVGRKTYIVDAAGDDKRTDYVSVSNTMIALILLVFGGVGAALQSIAPEVALAFYSVICLAGAALALRLGQPAE